ncbi:RNase P/MRP, p29 subunit, partial [Peniophora sp. CONT]
MFNLYAPPPHIFDEHGAIVDDSARLGHLGDTSRARYTSKLPFVPSYVQSTLSTPDPAQLYRDRVEHRQLPLENPDKPSAARKERGERLKRKQAETARRKSRVPGRKAVNDKGTWKLVKEDCRFELFLTLHGLWMGYMSELLNLKQPPPSNVADPGAMPSAAGMHAKLVKADMHGAFISVKESKNAALVGIAGIVVHESEGTFRIVTKKDKLRLIPKRNSIFTLAVPLYSTQTSSLPSAAESEQNEGLELKTVLDAPHIVFSLYGNQFAFRAAERAGKKFKAKETIEL